MAEPIDPEVPEEPMEPVVPTVLMETVGMPEPINFDNSSNAFYGAPFGVVANADNGNYAHTQDVGQKTEGPPESNEAFILRERAKYVPIVGTFDSQGMLGMWNHDSPGYQELENVVSTSSGFDRNMIIKNQYTKTNAWGE